MEANEKELIHHVHTIDLKDQDFGEETETIEFLETNIEVEIATNTFEQNDFSLSLTESTTTNAIDAGIDYIVQNQSDDGSWNNKTNTTFLETNAIIELLESVGTSTYSQSYASATSWLFVELPRNSQEIADRVRGTVKDGYGVAVRMLNLTKQKSLIDGGFGYSVRHQSDPVTSAKVLRAIEASGFSEEGDTTLISILVYLNENQNADGGWSEAPEAGSSVFATTHVLEALESYQGLTLSGSGGSFTTNDMIAAALSYLSNIQESDGTWGGDLTDTALAYRQLTRYGTEMVYQDEALAFMLDAQEVEGSWDGGNFYKTAKVLQALIDADLSRPDLTILDVQALTSLENGTTSQFQIITLNEGGQSVTDGVLYMFIDDYLFATYDLATLGFAAGPGQQFNVNVGFTDSNQFVGDTEFRWYIETSNEFDYADNWYSSVFNFAENVDGVAALPVYHVEYASSSAGAPIARYEWLNKPDSNRSDYAVLFKEAGAPTWFFIPIGNPNATAVNLSGFVEGDVYDLTLGVLYDSGASLRFFSGSFPTVSFADDPLTYAGTVSGTATINNRGANTVNLSNVNQTGVLTEEDGQYTFSDVFNGSNLFWVDESVLYEQNFTKVTIPANGSATNTRLFTRLKSDTEGPVVSSFEVVGESDLVFENNQTVQLSVVASDNEVLKEADFRLIDPVTGDKSYLGTSFFAPVGTTTATFDWFVPTDVVGAGYELEVIVQDYQNNDSIPALFGPFEVTAGAVAPSITLIEPDNATNTADEFFTITWEDEDEDDDATIALYYDTDASGEGGTLIVDGLSEDSPLDQYSWDALAVPDGDYYIYATIGDGSATSTSYSEGFVTLVHINDAPVAEDDSYSVDEDDVLTTTASTSVLINDTDIDNATLTASVIASTTNGTLSFNSDGTFTYTPDADFNGTDTFVYEVSDGEFTDTATVTIDVLAVNDAPETLFDNYFGSEDAQLVATTSVLTNDSDVDGDALTAALVSNVATGTLVLDSDGTFTYDPPADFFGTTTFTYVASDGQATSTSELVTLSIKPINDAPVAQSDSFTTDEDIALNDTVIANDSDLEDDVLSVSVLASTTNGSLSLNANGDFAYTPPADFNGTDTFTYELSDGSLTDSATVTIDVLAINDTPVVVDDTYAMDEDTTLQASTSVLSNDTDVDGDALTAALVAGVATGTLNFNTDGTFDYTPPADFNGNSTFTYVATDGEATSSEATVVITITAVNDAPVANDDSFSTDEDTQLSDAVLANDSDIDGDMLSVTLVSSTTNGTLSLTSDGVFSYTPDQNFNGTDTFTYELSDGDLTDTATVTLDVVPVNDAPVAIDDAFTTDEDTTLNENVLNNDIDLDGDTLTASIVSSTTNGVLSLSTNGDFTYTPDKDFNGFDLFVYEVTDGELIDTATVTIEMLSVNDLPVLVDDGYVMDEDTTLNATTSVLANDTDPDGDILTAFVVDSVATGTLLFNFDGTFDYTPPANFNGSSMFTYTVDDGSGASSSVATVAIVINNVNDPPLANAEEYQGIEDVFFVASTSVLANDTDIDGDSLTAVLLTDVATGTLNLDPDGTFTYDPSQDFFATTSFTYVATDGAATSTEQIVYLYLAPVNDAPVAVADSLTINEDSPTSTGNVLANDSDVDSLTLTAALVSSTTNGALALAANGDFTYTPDPNFNGIDTFVYAVSDGELSANATVTIEVLSVHDAPIALDDDFTDGPYVGIEEEPLIIPGPGYLENDFVDGELAAAFTVNGPDNFDLYNDGSLEFYPEENVFGIFEVGYYLQDAVASTSNVATITVEILNINDEPVPADPLIYIGLEDAQLAPTSSILAEAYDVDGDELTVSLVRDVATGTLTLSSDGFFTYDPPANWIGDVTFDYALTDGTVTIEPLTVYITIIDVNDPPVANDDFYVIDEDIIGNFNVTENDFDIDNGIPNVISVSTSTNGITEIHQGNVRYTPNQDFFGPDSFTYVVSDGVATDTASVTIDVLPVNDPPNIQDDQFVTDEDTLLTENVLTNDEDRDGDVLTAALVSSTTNGTLTFNASGTFTYMPHEDFNGFDSFTYEISDGEFTDGPGTVQIEVLSINDVPEITLLEPDELGEIATSSFEITWIDDDPDDAATISLYADVDGSGADGQLIVAGLQEQGANGSYIWDTILTPNGEYFIYAVIDDITSSSTAYASGTVLVSKPTETVYEDAEDGLTLGWVVLDNDPAGATIANVDDPEQGRVIELTGSSTQNTFALNKDTGGTFDNTTEFNASWDMNFAAPANLVWRVELNNSVNVLMLYSAAFPPGCSRVGTAIQCGIPVSFYDGTWHMVTRDLDADVAQALPNVTLTGVENFAVQGSGRVDNIKLFSD